VLHEVAARGASDVRDCNNTPRDDATPREEQLLPDGQARNVILHRKQQ